MQGIFLEFENENSLRSYPFAAGCIPQSSEGVEVPPGLFVDAALYPVNPSGTLYLSEVAEDGTVSISDDTGVIMTCAAPTGKMLEFRDASPFSRHVGTMVASSAEALAEFVGRRTAMAFGREATAFASTCVSPIVIDGVISVDVADTGAVSGMLNFENKPDDEVRVSTRRLEDGRDTLRFDVLPSVGRGRLQSIRRVICVVDGKTPFRIAKLSHNTVALHLQDIDKEVICAEAHRENAYEVADTCKCKVKPADPEELPETYQLEEVFIPETKENAFYLVVPNYTGYANPLSLTLEDGMAVPKITGPDVKRDGEDVDLPAEELLDDMSSKGVVLQVPGLSGGMI